MRKPARAISVIVVLLWAAPASAQTDQPGLAFDSFAVGAQVDIAVSGYNPSQNVAPTLVAGKATVARFNFGPESQKPPQGSNSADYNPTQLDLTGFLINWSDASVNWGDGTLHLALNPTKKSTGQIVRKTPSGPPGSSVELDFVFDLFLEVPVNSPQGFVALVAHNEEPLHLVGHGDAIPPLEIAFTSPKRVLLYDSGMNEVGSLTVRSFVPVLPGHGLLLNQVIDLAKGFAALAGQQK
jgi:hypothetical protein